MWRLLGAAAGLPVDFHTDNVDAERQVELGSNLDVSGLPSSAGSRGASVLLKACKGGIDALAQCTAGSQPRDPRVLAFVQDTILELQRELHRDGLLLCAARGEAGETVLHYAYLLREYALASWILELEPMLLPCCYVGSKYGGETALHILSAQVNSIGEIRALARRALHPLEHELARGGASSAGSAITASAGTVPPAPPRTDRQRELEVSVQRQAAWRLLHAATGGTLVPEWSRAWLRDAWCRTVNSVAWGDFFAKAPVGTCYYGGTPLAISTVLDYADVVRFLVVEVGCACSLCWGAEGSTTGISDELYAGELPPAGALVDWDPAVCARIDSVDQYGNNAAHLAVLHHSRAHVFNLLDTLYERGYGRWDSASRHHSVRGGVAGDALQDGVGAPTPLHARDKHCGVVRDRLSPLRSPAPPVFSVAMPSAPAARTTPSLLDLVNVEGLTPLTLAASLGKRELFEALWTSRARPPEWAWGGITAVCYPLDQIDDIGQAADDDPWLVSHH